MGQPALGIFSTIQAWGIMIADRVSGRFSSIFKGSNRGVDPAGIPIPGNNKGCLPFRSPPMTGFGFALWGGLILVSAPDSPIFYGRDIRPILRKTAFIATARIPTSVRPTCDWTHGTARGPGEPSSRQTGRKPAYRADSRVGRNQTDAAAKSNRRLTEPKRNSWNPGSPRALPLRTMGLCSPAAPARAPN